MLKSRKIKMALQIIAGLLILWFSIGITDYCCVSNEKRPIFCIELSEGEYYGLGYSFDTFPHPFTGKIEYTYYILGFKIESNFTNSVTTLE